MTPHELVDRNGKNLRVGDKVRIVGVPDLSGMAAKQRAQSLPVFEHLVGSYKTIEGFDQFGCAGFTFAINKGQFCGYHTVWIEPFLLHIPERSNRSFKVGRAKRRRAP
jgi:hypothetical protein